MAVFPPGMLGWWWLGGDQCLSWLSASGGSGEGRGGASGQLYELVLELAEDCILHGGW